jgi:protein phosphatase
LTVHPLELATRSHVGLVRAHNEDAFAALAAEGVVVVADGMGGHNAGEVASELAVEAAANALCDVQEADLADDIDSLMHIGRAAELANGAILERTRREPQLAGMGTTAVLAMFRHQRIFYAHVGDSRLYRMRDGRLRALTRDHTLVQQLLDQGLFRDRAEARLAGVGDNVLIRSLGVDGAVEVDVGDAPLQRDDIYLFCTDGLCGKVPDEELQRLLCAPGHGLDALADRLQQAALDAGGSDNITLVLARPRL